MKKRVTFVSGPLSIFLILVLQVLWQENRPVFAEGEYPNLGMLIHINLPDCIPGFETIIVSNNTQLQFALENPDIKVICLNPGHYSEIRLLEGGFFQSPRYLIPNHAGPTIQNPWELPQNERVIIDSISFESEFWYVVGLNVAGDQNRIVEFGYLSNGNVLDRMLIEGKSERLQEGTGNHTMVRIWETAFYNTIQNSVLRDPPRIPRKDSHCLVIRDSPYNTIINNQFYDCAGDGIQINTAITPGWDNRGNKIFHNEIYLSSRLYASCNDPSIDANLNGPGDCACAENAIDIKRNVDTPVGNNQDKMEIRGNTMYGFRQTHQACGGTGDNTAAAIYIHKYSKDILIQKNLIAYAYTGILLKDSGYGGPDNISVLNNMLFNITPKRALHIAGGDNSQFTHNTIVLTLEDGNVIGRQSIAITGNAGSGIISNNLVLSANEPYEGFYDPETGAASSFVIKNNGYVAQATPMNGLPGDNDMVFPTEPISNFDEYCFEIEKLTTENYQCDPFLIPNPDAATVDVVNHPSFGLTYDFFFRPRALPYDLGAAEIQTFDFHMMLPFISS